MVTYYGSGAQWWRPYWQREQPHAGLDYAQFIDPSGGAHAWLRVRVRVSSSTRREVHTP